MRGGAAVLFLLAGCASASLDGPSGDAPVELLPNVFESRLRPDVQTLSLYEWQAMPPPGDVELELEVVTDGRVESMAILVFAQGPPPTYLGGIVAESSLVIPSLGDPWWSTYETLPARIRLGGGETVLPDPFPSVLAGAPATVQGPLFVLVGGEALDGEFWVEANLRLRVNGEPIAAPAPTLQGVYGYEVGLFRLLADGKLWTKVESDSSVRPVVGLGGDLPAMDRNVASHVAGPGMVPLVVHASEGHRAGLARVDLRFDSGPRLILENFGPDCASGSCLDGREVAGSLACNVAPGSFSGDWDALYELNVHHEGLELAVVSVATQPLPFALADEAWSTDGPQPCTA